MQKNTIRSNHYFIIDAWRTLSDPSPLRYDYTKVMVAHVPDRHDDKSVKKCTCSLLRQIFNYELEPL